MGLKTRTSKNAHCCLRPQKLSATTSRRAPSSLFAVLCFSCSWDSDCRAVSVPTLLQDFCEEISCDVTQLIVTNRWETATGTVQCMFHREGFPTHAVGGQV